MRFIICIIIGLLWLTGCSTGPPLEFSQVRFFIDDNCGDGQSRSLLMYSTSDSTNWILVDSFTVLTGREDERAFFTSRTVLIQLLGDEECRTNFYSLPESSSGLIRMKLNTNVNGQFTFTEKTASYDSVMVVLNRAVLNLNRQSFFSVDDIANSSQVFTTSDFEFSQDNLSSNALYRIQVRRYRGSIITNDLIRTFYTHDNDVSISIGY